MTRRKTKWTADQLKEIWAAGIKCYPPPKQGERYGCSDKFMPININNLSVRKRYKDYPIFNRTHDHRYETILLWGGTGSGKTATSVGVSLEYLFSYPGIQGLAGGRVYKDLYQNVISMYRDRLTIVEPWDHPSVISYPSEDGRSKILTIQAYPGAKYSSLEFFQFDQWIRVRGRNRDFCTFEEISQMSDGSIMDELPRRCRSTLLPCSQVICTTNPPESDTHWIYQKWNIHQHKKNYQGEITPIGKPCSCQFCQDCLNQKLGEWSFDESGFCTNPECTTKYRKAKKDSAGNILQLGPPTEREYYYMNHKGSKVKMFCPGNQYFWRVLFSSAVDNPHVRADYIQSQSNSDSRINALYVHGEPLELNANNVFNSFTQLNVREFDKPISYDKDIIWSFDFNNRPQCSVICQENYDDKGQLNYIDQIDEIILFDIKEIYDKVNPLTGERERGASPEHVAAEFMKKYPKFEKTIYMYGDPTAVNKTSGPLEVTKYQIIYNILSKAGYKVQMMVKKEPGRQIAIIDRVNNANWLFKDYQGNIKFYINPRCKYTITSVKDLKWDKSGEKPDKRLIDEYARRTTEVIFPEDVYKYVRLVSHPADALTYYFYQKFPLIKGENLQFLQIPGESTFIVENGKMRERKYKPEKKEPLDNVITDQQPETLAESLANMFGLSSITEQDDEYYISDNFLSYFS